MACIILGITGSIAAYKAADIASALVKSGHEVHCVWHGQGPGIRYSPHPAHDLPQSRLLLL